MNPFFNNFDIFPEKSHFLIENPKYEHKLKFSAAFRNIILNILNFQFLWSHHVNPEKFRGNNRENYLAARRIIEMG